MIEVHGLPWARNNWSKGHDRRSGGGSGAQRTTAIDVIAMMTLRRRCMGRGGEHGNVCRPRPLDGYRSARTLLPDDAHMLRETTLTGPGLPHSMNSISFLYYFCIFTVLYVCR